MKITGKIKGIKTTTKMEAEGLVVHTTRITLELLDLDQVVLENLAYAESGRRKITFEVDQNIPRGVVVATDREETLRNIERVLADSER